MSNIKIICDTMNDVPKDIMDKYDVEMIPVTIVFEGKEYKAGVDITSQEFYKLLRNSESMPTTSQISYTNYVNVFQKYINQGKKILYLVGSSAASGTYQAATLAKNDIDGDIYIFDTYSLSIGGGMLIKEAAKMAEEGLEIEEIIKKLESYKKDIEVFFSVDSLDYLYKGGRISGTKAAIGNLLNIKPILKIEDGLVKQKTQVRGSKKIIPSLIEQLKEQIGQDFSNKEVYVGCGDNVEIISMFVDKVKKELNPKSVHVFEIGPCVGSHSGPSVIGIGCLNKD